MPAKQLFLPAAALLSAALIISCNSKPSNVLPADVSRQSAVIKTVDNYIFRDLNKNGKLDVYEDSRQPVEARVNDLLAQMSL